MLHSLISIVLHCFSKVYLFYLEVRITERVMGKDREKDLASTDSLFRWPQWLGLGWLWHHSSPRALAFKKKKIIYLKGNHRKARPKPGGRKPICVFCGLYGSKHLSHHLLLPRHMRRKLNWKHRIAGMQTRDFEMGCRHPKRGFYLCPIDILRYPCSSGPSDTRFCVSPLSCFP